MLFLSWWILILHDSNFLAQFPNTLAVFFLFPSWTEIYSKKIEYGIFNMRAPF